MLACAYILTWITFVLVGCAEWGVAQTGKLQSIHSRRNNFSGSEGQYSPSSQSILAQFNSLPRVVWHTTLFSLSVCGKQKMLPKSKTAAVSSWKQMALTNVCLSVIYQLLALLNIIQNYSVFGPSAFVDDPALFLRTKPICVELYWSRIGPSISYLSPCVL